jgi:uncharacterized membrane protein
VGTEGEEWNTMSTLVEYLLDQLYRAEQGAVYIGVLGIIVIVVIILLLLGNGE